MIELKYVASVLGPDGWRTVREGIYDKFGTVIVKDGLATIPTLTTSGEAQTEMIRVDAIQAIRYAPGYGSGPSWLEAGA